MNSVLLTKEANKLSLSSELLESIVKSIVSVIPAKSIYIFGSYARVSEHGGSDVDIYVVTKDDKKRPSDYGFLAYKSLRKSQGYDRSYDLMSSAEKVFQYRAKDIWNIEYTVNKEGVKIYG